MNALEFGTKPRKNAVPLLFFWESEVIIDGCGIISMYFFEAEVFSKVI